MGKFPFRFLLPPVLLLLLLIQDASPALHTPRACRNAGALSCHHYQPPGLGHHAGHQVCGGGRWVGIWLDLLTAPSGGSPGALPPWSPWGSPLPADRGVPRRQPEELLPFSPRAQREPQEWAAHSFTLYPTHPGNCLGKRLRLGVPGASRLRPESWGWSPMGLWSLNLWLPVGGGAPG